MGEAAGAEPGPETLPSVQAASPAAPMEINRPSARPLTPEEQVVFEEFRQTLHQKVLAGGLHGDDIRQLLAGIRAHPDASEEIVAAVAEEVRSLGQPLVDLRWD